MRALLAVLVMMTLAFSGCTGQGGEDDGDGSGDLGAASSSGTQSGTSSSTRSGTSSAPGPGGGSPQSNRAPTASLAASVATGAAPLRVNFTIGGQDADGDALTWTLAFGDGSPDATGTAVPGNASHQYAAGAFNATLTVSDGRATGNMTLVLNVTSATVQLEAIRITGEISGAYVGTPVGVPEGTYTEENEHKFTLLGQPAKMTLHLVWGESGVDLDYAVLAPDGTPAGSQAAYNAPVPGAFDATEPDIVVEDAAQLAKLGEWTVVVSPGAAVKATYTVDITFA